MTRIRVEGIVKRFGDTPAINGVSLDVRPGELFTLVGPSGCGKTTLLRIIAGLLEQDAGHILFNEDRMDDVPPYLRNIGVVFQNYAIFPHLTVGENIAYGLREQGEASDADIRARVDECLEWVGLPGSGAMAPSDLSGGMKKRIGLARALAPRPETILYDEPTTGLDPFNARRISDLILSLQERLKVTSLVITHDIQGAFAVSDRIALVRQHRLALVVDAAEAKRSPGPALEEFMTGKHAGGAP